MKRLTLTLLIAIMALTSTNVEGKSPQTSTGSVPFDKLARMLATGAQWKESNLSKMGLKKLAKRYERTEYGSDIIYVYGRNAKANITKNWNVKLTATGPHAFAVEFAGATDNSTSIYFKEKADHDAFLIYAKKHGYYKQERMCGIVEKRIGGEMIEGDGYFNGWYVISFHGG